MTEQSELTEDELLEAALAAVDQSPPEALEPEPAGQSRRAAATRTAGIAKPDVAAVGREPPPQAQNRLRSLSELHVVRFADRSEVLLPGDVPGDVEHQGAEPDRRVRRDVSRPAGGVTPAAKYLAEREAKRHQGIDIPRHILCDPNRHGGDAAFAGIRDIDGQRLALLKRNDDMLVLPIDPATAQRLARVKVGDPIAITPNGSIRTRGRSR